MVNVERITPKDRAAWHRARGRDITASVVGALFGVHEFTSLYQLWAVKTGRLPYSSEETPAMERGQLLEPVAVELIRKYHPDWRLDYNAADNTYYRDPAARLGATPDLIVDAPDRGRGVVQIKSVEASIYRRKWVSADGVVEAPLWIALQTILEMHLTGGRWAAVAPLVVGNGLEMPIIEIDTTHAAAVVERMECGAAKFWLMVTEGREPEPDYAQDAALIDQLYDYGDPREEVDLTGDNRIPELLDERAEAFAARKAAEARISAAEAEIKSKMGRAEIAHIGGGRRIKWTTHKRAGYTAPPSTYRVLRTPKQQQ